MLKIEGVKKSYGDFHLDCSLEVESGRTTGILLDRFPGNGH